MEQQKSHFIPGLDKCKFWQEKHHWFSQEAESKRSPNTYIYCDHIGDHSIQGNDKDKKCIIEDNVSHKEWESLHLVVAVQLGLPSVGIHQLS